MLQNLFRLLGRLYSLLLTLIVVALLSVAAVLTWHFYQQERLASQLSAEGQPLTVQIERTDREPRALWDALGNFVYVGFTYHGQSYETRLVNDTLWVGEGDRLRLLYQPRLDVFGQAPQRIYSPNRVVSRLINWTAATDFTLEAKALGLFILTIIALFFMSGGLLVSLTGLTFIQTLARGVLLVCLSMAALFFTYSAVQYYRYAAQLRRNGQPLEVAVVDTDRTTHGRRTSWYTYEATFRFNGQEHVVPIEKADYERLSAQNRRLAVRYDPALNDFISADYTPGFSELVAPLFFWLLLLLIGRPARSRQAAVPPAAV
jgi:hypothetical protein